MQRRDWGKPAFGLRLGCETRSPTRRVMGPDLVSALPPQGWQPEQARWTARARQQPVQRHWVQLQGRARQQRVPQYRAMN
jgi:hypothetical protein